MTLSQIEFPLPVAVCAWCKPKARHPVTGPVTHGICLRHLRKLKLEARKLAAAHSFPAQVDQAPQPC